MIFDSLANSDNYREMPAIHLALKYLKTLNPDKLPVEPLELDGKSITAVAKAPKTRPMNECRFEAHRRFIDIHCTIEGIEGIAIRDVADLQSAGDFDISKDIGFYTGDHHAIAYLHPGQFMVCFPEDAHKPGIMQDGPLQVSKILVKIAVTH
ncbi:MAG: hypothetical protein A3J97_00490 [Spirochaetes bacterium RIFOXYC1_FULL_54_7]|nr:MAG: hypothetical protein A3J97_00490 [Spirochaetes bacterium RIFOXYC1_FULL_54_7]